MTDPVEDPPVLIEDIDRPSVDDIGALLHARTTSMGSEVGTFNSTTLPTGAQVTDLIEMAAADLRSRIGSTVPTSYSDEVRRLVALQTASLIEASYFPGELETDRSAYRQYTAMYLTGVASLTAQVICYAA